MLTKSPFYIVVLLFLVAIAILFFDSHHSLFLTINNAGSHIADKVWIFSSIFGNKAFVLILVLLVFWHKPQLLRATLIAGLIAILISFSITPLIALARPPAVLDPVSFHLIGERLTGGSFPSAHAMGTFAILGSIAFYFKNRFLSLLIFMLSSFVGLSYIMLGVYWPIDILIGAALGWVCAWLGVYLISANLWRDNDIWNYLNYVIYLLIAVYLVWAGDYNNDDLSWAIKAMAILGVVVAIWSLLWLKKGGNKEPISVAGWLS